MIPSAQVPGANYETGDARGMTILLFGNAGAWKTTWAAQWPGVIFLSIAAEGGDDALKLYPAVAAQLMQASQLKECPPVFNTGKPPRILIHSAEQFASAVDQICDNYKQWNIYTVVVDSLTHLIDLWIDDYIQHAERNNPGWRRRVQKQGGELLNPPEWGFLNMFLRSPRVKFGNCGLNVIWTCLAKELLEQNPSNMAEPEIKEIVPMITGATKIKLPSACKLWIHAETTKIAHPQAMGRMSIQPTFWTASSPKVTLRHKYWNKFPHGRLDDPEWGVYPTFRALWYELGEYVYVGQR